MLDARQLLLLQTVARSGSYTAAARELGLTQPAVTYQMRALEREVGVELAVRRGREMHLTEGGRLLLLHAENVLSALRAAAEDLGNYAGRDAGSVRVIAFASASATIVAQSCGALARTSPGVVLELMEAEPDEARRAVRRGDADIALTYHFEFPDGRPLGPTVPDQPNPLQRLPLLTDRSFVVMPSSHPAAQQREVDAGDLIDDVWCLAADRLHWTLAAGLGYSPHVREVPDDFVSMQSFVANGLGICIVPGLAVSAHSDPRTVARPLLGWPVRSVAAEVWSDLLRTPAVSLALAALEGAAREAGPSDADATLGDLRV